MSETIEAEPHSLQIGTKMALLTLAALVPLIGALMALSKAAGIAEFMFVGFVFTVYWLGMKGMKAAEFTPALLGSLCGVLLAAILKLLPAALGRPGLLLAGLALAVSLFFLIQKRAQILLNSAFTLMLTICTCTAFRTRSDFVAAGEAILVAAAYSGGLVLLGKRAVSMRKRVPQ